MKKALIIIMAFAGALIITELIVSCVLNFPAFGVLEKVKGITTLNNRGEIYKPHSKYINNEDGYKVFTRNNFGLTGSEIIKTDSSKFILVLGNSFIEGYQVNPDSLSTALFQRLCSRLSQNYQVVNLGASGHDAFDLWLRSNYFERIFPPFRVILIITEYNLSHNVGNLDFKLPVYFGEVNNSVTIKITTFLRNTSSFLNLIATAYKYSSRKNADNDDVSRIEDTNLNGSSDTVLSPGKGLGACLLEFYKKYGEKFIAVSIIQDPAENKAISEFCFQNQIFCNSSGLLNPEYEIKGRGHLNIKGNKKLGDLLYESFVRSISK